MNKNNKIAHLADLHVRFNSRSQEIKTIFEKTIIDIKKENPRRIVIAGDFFHTKINLSPSSIELVGWFLSELSTISPVDTIGGNHDENLASLSQGNSIESVIKLLGNGFIITNDIKTLPLPKSGNPIYFFKESGFYDIDDEIVYGIYACSDGKILNLSERIPNKKYISIFHGPIFGARMDNGYEAKGDELVKPSIFNNQDIVLCGDFHEFQVVQEYDKDKHKPAIVFCGSILQNNFGESMEKGYVIWNIDNFTFKRKIILNDYGFCKATISAGENIEERVRNLKMSLNKKKTKVQILYEDYQENYSIEKLNQIEHVVKKIHGCEYIDVDWKELTREKTDIEDGIEEKDYVDSESFEALLIKYLEQNDFEDIDDVIELSREIDKKINYKQLDGRKWILKKMVTSNLFSFPEKETIFDFEKMKGITGIFGENYTGKSNIIRSLVWILYKKILDDGEPNKLVNIYTKSDAAYGKCYIEIGGSDYCIERTVKVKIKKDGTPDVSYNVNYSKWNGESWIKEDSENAATEKKQTEDVIINALGTYEDFTKVVLQSQSGTGSYLTLSQQPKNDLINRYLGLEIFRDKYDVANDTFKKIKAVQKSFGDPVEIENQIKTQNEKIEQEEKNIIEYNNEKVIINDKIDKFNEEILELTKQIIKTEIVEETNEEVIKNKIQSNLNNKTKEEGLISPLQQWLGENFKKELPQQTQNSSSIESALNKESELFKKEKETYVILEKWINDNPKKDEKTEVEIDIIESEITSIKDALLKLSDKLKISKGEKCPTCNHVKQEANPEMEKDCLDKIERGKIALTKKQEELNLNKSIISANNNIDKEINRLESIKLSLKSRKINIDKLKEDLIASQKFDETNKHNLLVDSKQKELDNLKASISNREKEETRLNEQLTLLSKNKGAIESNALINKRINDIKDDIKIEKVNILQFDNKLKESFSNKSVANNNIENLNEKLSQIQESDRIYKKYSIYIQAVHRDGIPAQIIKNKLPIINYRINNVLKNMVDFKIELFIKQSGDIKEQIYYNSSKSDSLPLTMGSGAQKFIGSVAIKDALHYVSKLTKPSLCIIDEGFGTLDDRHTIEIKNLLSYFRTRYQNTWVITHKNEVKDFVDNIIQTRKSPSGVSDKVLEENPNAGVTAIDFS